MSSARTGWHWEPRETGTGVLAISAVGLRNGPCSLSEASEPTSSLEKDNLCALHRSLTAEEVGLWTSHWKAMVESDADAWLSPSLTSYHRQITAPTLILQAPAGLLTDSNCILTREEGEQLAIAIPNARLITIAKADHYIILFRHNPEAIRDVDLTARCGLQARAGMLPTTAVSRSVEGCRCCPSAIVDRVPCQDSSRHCARLFSNSSRKSPPATPTVPPPAINWVAGASGQGERLLAWPIEPPQNAIGAWALSRAHPVPNTINATIRNARIGLIIGTCFSHSFTLDCPLSGVDLPRKTLVCKQ